MLYMPLSNPSQINKQKPETMALCAHGYLFLCQQLYTMMRCVQQAVRRTAVNSPLRLVDLKRVCSRARFVSSALLGRVVLDARKVHERYRNEWEALSSARICVTGRTRM